MNAMQDEAAMGAEQPEGEANAEQPGNGQVDPQTANAYRRIGLAAMKIVYSPEGSSGLVKMMQGQDPVQAVAMASIVVIERLKEQIQGLSPEFVYMLAPNIAAFVTEIGGAAKLFKPSAQIVEGAVRLIEQQMGGQQEQAQQPQPAAQAQPGLIVGAMGG